MVRTKRTNRLIEPTLSQTTTHILYNVETKETAQSSVQSLGIVLLPNKYYCNHSTYIYNSSSEVELEKCMTLLLKLQLLGVK